MSELDLSAQIDALPLHKPFAIAGKRYEAIEVVHVTAERDGVRGHGECTPYARFGTGPQKACAQIAALDTHGLDRNTLLKRLPAGPARNAVDAALWDLEAKQAGCRVWELEGLGGQAPDLISTITIGIDTPDAMARAARSYEVWPVLKIKLDRSRIMERMAAIREHMPQTRLIVDANASWDIDTLNAVAGPLAGLGVEMIEQPLPPGQDGELKAYRGALPLAADESCQDMQSLARLEGHYQTVNLKLDKVGGLTAGLVMAQEARDRGFEIMVGCMLGSSLAMAPAMMLARQAVLCDLDGPYILGHDRPGGLSYRQGRLSVFGPDLWG